MRTTQIRGNTYTRKDFQPIKNGKTNLFELYSKPSQTKRKIFEYRKENLNEIYGLTGNAMFFSIYGNIKDESGTIQDVRITKSYNYILKNK